MRLKTKLFLSIAFLFSLIVLLSGVGIYYLNRLAADSRAVLQENYRSLTYVQDLNRALDEALAELAAGRAMPAQVLDKGKTAIRQQMANVTEPGEQQLTDGLAAEFEVFEKMAQASVAGSASESGSVALQVIPQAKKLQDLSWLIYSLNEEALLKKNERANQTAGEVKLYMAIFGGSGVLVALLFILGLPAYIYNPLKRLNDAIKQVAAKNYDQQLDVSSEDELGELAGSFNQMAVRLREYDESNLAKLLFEKKRIDAIINQMNEAIIGLDENNTVLFANALALELFNLKATDIEGQPVTAIAAKNQMFRKVVTDMLTGAQPENDRLLRIVRGKKEKFFARQIIPVAAQTTGNGPHQNIGSVVVLTDMTEFSERDRAKTSFIATISHELKTPIASILMSLKLLQNCKTGDLNADQSELLQSIREDGDRMLKITGELLKMAQVETGNIQLDIRPVAAGDILRLAVQAVHQQAQEKKVHILTETNGLELAPVLADGDKTSWVLVNLLNNAIRYSPPDKTVRLRLSLNESDGISFSVKDEGPGIPAAFQERVFEKYFRLPQSDKSGSGLGLAISREFLKAMNGDIRIHSTPGEGSEFLVRLPLMEG